MLLLDALPPDLIKLIFNSIDFDRLRPIFQRIGDIGTSQVHFANCCKVIRQSVGDTLRKEARAKCKSRVLPLDIQEELAFTKQLDAEHASKQLIKFFQRGIQNRIFANTLKSFDVLRKEFCRGHRKIHAVTRSTVLEFTSNEKYIVCICEMSVNYKKSQLTGYSASDPEKQTWLRVFGSDSDHRHSLCEIRIPYESTQVAVDRDVNIALCTNSVSEDLQRVLEYRIQKTGSTFELKEIATWSPVRSENEEEEDLGHGEDFINQTSRVVFLKFLVHCVSVRKLDEYTISTKDNSRCFHPSKEVDEGVGLPVTSVLCVGGALAIALESGQILIHESATMNILSVLKTRWRIDKCPDFSSQRWAKYNNMAIDSVKFSNNLRSIAVCDRAARMALFKTSTKIFDSSQNTSFGFTSRPRAIQLTPMFQIHLSLDTIHRLRVEFSFCSRFLVIAAGRRQQWKKIDLYDMSCLAFGHSEASASTSPAAITFNSKNSMLVLAREGGLFRLSRIA